MNKKFDRPSWLKILLEQLEENKAYEIKHYYQPVDWIEHAIILTATSARHIDALLDKINQMRIDNSDFRNQFQERFQIEGMANSGWVIATHNQLIIHLFIEDMRNYYELDELWEKSKKK